MPQPYVLALIFGLAGGFWGLLVGYSPLIFGGVAFAVALTVASQKQIAGLTKQLDQLQQQLAQALPSPQREAPTQTESPPQVETAEPTPEAQEPPVSAPPTPRPPPPVEASGTAASGQPPAPTPNQLERLIRGFIQRTVEWFTGGNLFTRVGIVLLFIGVGFLIKYAAGLGIITLEMRMIAIALVGIFLLVAGQRLLRSRRDYGLMLQGAAVGILYLDIFGAYSLYGMLPSTLTFVLLFAVSALAATLAVLQNAPLLAHAGFAGGFLAPVLASSGSGNYVGLFSYYVVLNLALLAIAWFKSWRGLNLIGFYLTYGVAAVWGFESYTPDKYASTQPFLLAFFLIFVSIPVLYARRQPVKLKGYVDGSLLFGTSIISFAMQLVLVDHFEYGAAWSALAFGMFYVALAVSLWRRDVAEERLLVEVFLALGVVFVTLVIPFALGASDTAGAWALEGVGLIWIGMRQQRQLARAAGVLLQLAAALFWAVHEPDPQQTMFLNSGFLAGIMISIAAFLSAHLFRDAQSKWETPLEAGFIVWFVAWWFGIGCREIFEFATDGYTAGALVGFGALSAGAISVLSRRWQWPPMHATALIAVALFVLAAVAHLFSSSTALHENLGWLAWPLGFAIYYWVLHRAEAQVPPLPLACSHVLASLLLVVVLQWELWWLGDTVLGLHRTWLFALSGVLIIAALQVIHRARFWPVAGWPRVYTGACGGALAFCLGLMILASFENSGAAPPLPWIPLLNPLDAMALLGGLSLAIFCLDLRTHFARLHTFDVGKATRLFLSLIGFVWLNVTLFRVMHHWVGIPYDLDAQLASSTTQTALTLLWVLLGMLVVIFASRKGMRNVWIAGGVLLAVVVVKLFVEDLANTGTLARIVSFLGVGAVLILIGYFSPLPPRKGAES